MRRPIESLVEGRPKLKRILGLSTAVLGGLGNRCGISPFIIAPALGRAIQLSMDFGDEPDSGKGL